MTALDRPAVSSAPLKHWHRVGPPARRSSIRAPCSTKQPGRPQGKQTARGRRGRGRIPEVLAVRGPNRRHARSGRLPLLPGDPVRPGSRRPARRARAGDAGLEQLPGPHEPSRGQGGCRGGPVPVRHRLRGLAAAERNARDPRPARGAPGRLHGARGGAHLRDRLPGQPGRALLSARPLRRRDPRRARPCLHHRRLPPRLRPDLQVPPQRHERSREEAARGGRGQGQADRRRRRVLDGGRRREPPGDRGAQEPLPGAADGGRRARPRRLRRERPRHGRAFRTGARGRSRDGDVLEVARRDRRLRRGQCARDRAHQAQREGRDLLRRAPAGLGGRRAQGPRADRARARAAQATVGESPTS